jgi:hypothetical protein
MAISDLLERVKLVDQAGDDEIPDDAAELDADDELEEDPRPVRKRASLSVPASQGSVSAKEKKQVKDALSLLIKGPAAMVSLRDPHCGGAVADQADDIIKALVPIICRNTAMLGWFTSVNAPWLDFFALFMAFKPVVTTVFQHHVKHSIGDEAREPDDLSAYAAPTF